MARDNDDLDLNLDMQEIAEEAGRLFCEGLKLVGREDMAADESWFSTAGWLAVVGHLNAQTDGEYLVSELAQQIETVYLMAAGLPSDHGAGPTVALVWNGVVRMVAAAILEGELRGDNSVETWLSWLRIHLGQ